MHTCYHNTAAFSASLYVGGMHASYVRGTMTIKCFLLIVVVFLIESHAGSGLRITNTVSDIQYKWTTSTKFTGT